MARLRTMDGWLSLAGRWELADEPTDLPIGTAQVEGGAVMGISHALLEEVMFDESGIAQNNWISYPILKMSDIPEIKVVLLNNPKVGTYGGGSEAANALAAPAIAAALHDATGKMMRRLPLKPAYVQALLKT